MSEELPSIATKDAECYIDFEFQVPYHDALTSRELLAECIASATNEVLQPSNLQISDGEIDIEDLMLRPNENQPRFIGVVGWIRCKDRSRGLYMEALQYAQKNRKISKRLAEQSNIPRNKVSLAQFNSQFSNEDHVNRSFLGSTVKDFNKFKERTNSQANAANNANANDEEKVQPQADAANNADANDNANNLNNNIDDEKKAAEAGNTEQQATPEPMLEARSSVVVNELIANDETVEVDENHIPTIDEHSGNAQMQQQPETKQPPQDEHESADDHNDSSYQMVDGVDGDDQSSNEEQKTVDPKSLRVDALASPEVGAQSGDDFSNISPRVPPVHGLSPLLSASKDDTEVDKLKAEVAELKLKHQQELDHFTNKFNKLKREKQVDYQRQKSRLSMQIDEEIVSKEFAKKTEDKVHELETELLQKQKEQNNHIQQLQLQHQTELQKFDYKLRQTQQLHTLELNNIRSQHTFETEQLQKQIRALTGSLERESQKDRKINELTDENETLKAAKERVVNNYEMTIKRMNEESESSIQGEIDKRVKETAILRRELNEMRQRLNREQSKRDQLQTELYQLQNQNEEKDRFIAQLQSLYQKEKAKAARLQNKMSKSKRNIHKEEKLISEKEKQKIESGGHVRKPSKGLRNRTVTVSKIADTGATVIEIEKNKELDLAAMSNGGLLHIDPDTGDQDEEFLNQTDSEFEDDDADKSKKMMAEEEHNQEIALKNQEIEQLREKISNLESNMEALKVSNHEELQATQQKIGSLQQQLEQEQENFLKQNQMLEFKLKKKEGDNKNLEDQLQDLRYSHKRELRNLNDEMEKMKQDLAEKEEDIVNLEQHLDMVQEENARLKEYEEDIQDYEADMAELDDHYRVMLDEIKRQNQETQDKLNDYLHQKDEENDALKNTLHSHTETITELKSLLADMKKDEFDLSEKEKRLQNIIAISSPTKSNRVRESRESRELDDSDLAGVGYSEAEPQQDLDDVNANNTADFASQPHEQRPSNELGPVLDAEDSNINNMSDDERKTADEEEPERQESSQSQPQLEVEEDYYAQGQGQAEPEPDPEPETERASLGSMATDYIYKDEVEQMIESRVEEMKEKLKMQHALAIDTVESKHKQKYESMEQQYLSQVETLKQDQQSMASELQSSRNEVQQMKEQMQQQVKSAEESRISLLTSFMKEMDRMRDEIRKLNSEKGKYYSKSAYM